MKYSNLSLHLPPQRTFRFAQFALIWFILLSWLAPLADGGDNFAVTGPLTTARNSHSATLLPSGKVLVVGGNGQNGVLASAELFNPSTGTWSSTGALVTGRFQHTTTLLPNGKVLMVGGYASNFLASAELYDPGTGTWSETGALGSMRYRHTATLLANGKVLVVGGYNGSHLASAELYDPAMGTWSGVGSLTTAREHHTATLLPNGKVLVTGGSGSSGYLTSSEIFDPAAGTWSETSALAIARHSHTATLLLNGKLLVVGGGSSSGYLSSTELYDPVAGTWSGSGGITTARHSHTATLLPNGKLLIAGGTNGNYLASAQLYDPGAGTWSGTGSLVVARHNKHTATLLPTGKVLVAGGSNTSYLVSAELYDIAAGTWSGTGALAVGRYQHTATLFNDNVLVVGGSNASRLASAELYNLVTKTWSTTGDLATARFYHSATLLPNAKVLVAGGNNATTFASAELYDPAMGTWSATGALNAARYQHTDTLLSNGKVLVTGGYNGSNLASCELYDPATGSWSLTGALSNARRAHTATLLPNGKVFVVGGIRSGSGYLTSAEVYDPATGLWSPAGNLTVSRCLHSATLLPSGKVLVSAGFNGAALNTAELYDPATGIWSGTGTLTAARYYYNAILLPNGKVLVAGGNSFSSGLIASAEIYDPATGSWSDTGALVAARQAFTSTLLPDGKVILVGGNGNGSTFLSGAELYDPSLGFSAASQPQISSASFIVGDKLVLTGAGFRGFSSASGGNGGQDSSSNFPIVELTRLDNQQSVFLLPDSSSSFSDTSFTSMPVPDFPGYARVTVFTNGIPSPSFTVAGKGFAIITLGNLLTPYDGTPKSVSATTSPPGLAVNFTFAGSASLPTLAGNYPVVATISDATYQGSATGTLVIGYAINFTVTHGNIIGANSGEIRPKNTLVSLTANPNADYSFASWTGNIPGGTASTNPLSVTMDGHKTITANFFPNLATPTNLTLSKTYFYDNAALGTTIGQLNATDADAGDVLTYTFVDADGGSDNTLFSIVGNVLKTDTSYDYDDAKTRFIRVMATDLAGHSVEKSFTLTVVDGTPWASFVRRKEAFPVLPSYVNAIFQLRDGNDNPMNLPAELVDDPSSNLFIVQENGATVSPTESFLQVKKIDQVPAKVRTILLLDNSFSVGASLATIKDAAKTLVDGMFDKQEVAIYTFSGSSTMIKDFTGKSPSNQAALKSAINSITLGSPSTNLYGSVLAMLNLPKWKEEFSVEGIETGFLIVLTDGSDTSAVASLAEVIAKRDADQKAIYTVGLGAEIDPVTLEDMAITDGFIPVQNVNDLAQAFTTLQRRIQDEANSYYWLNYASPKRGNFNRTLTVSLKDNTNSGSEGKITYSFNSDGFTDVGSEVMIDRNVYATSGVSSLTLKNNVSITAKAYTILPPIGDPAYTWTVANPSLVTLTPLDSNGDRVTITPKGLNGSTTLTLTDTVNGLPSKTIPLVIGAATPLAPQEITFELPTNYAPTTAPFSLSATASSGLPVSFALVSGPGSLSGSTVTLSGGIGTVVIRASQPGDSTFAAALPKERSFTVSTNEVFLTGGGIKAAPSNVPEAGEAGGPPLDAKLASFGVPATDNDGNLAFLAKWSSVSGGKGSGLFLNSICLAKTGDEVTGIAGAKFKSFTDPVSGGGRVISIAALSGVTAPTSSAVVSCEVEGDSLSVTARTGDIAPDFNGLEQAAGAKFKSFKAVAISEGGLAIFAQLAGGVGAEKSTANTDLGLWIQDGANPLQLALREGQTVGSKTIKTLLSFAVGLGSPGQGRGWLSEPDGPSVMAAVIFTDKSQAVLSVSPRSGIMIITETGAVGTNGGPDIASATFASYSFPATNDLFTTTFLASMSVGSGGVTKTDARGIFVSNVTGAFTPLARVGGAAGTTGASFSLIKDPVLAADNGIAFPATLKGGTAKGLASTSLWWKPAGGSLTLLAQGGKRPSIDLPVEAQWKAFTSLAITSGGSPIFIGTLVPGKGGVTGATATGVWACDSSGEPRLLFRTGDTVGGKKIKSFNLLKTGLGCVGVTRSFNDEQLVWLATFTDKSTAIITTDLP